MEVTLQLQKMYELQGGDYGAIVLGVFGEEIGEEVIYLKLIPGLSLENKVNQ